jgi:hypothetical protein
MSGIAVQCQVCLKEITVPVEFAGRIGKCGNCGTPVVVPNVAASPNDQATPIDVPVVPAAPPVAAPVVPVAVPDAPPTVPVAAPVVPVAEPEVPVAAPERKTARQSRPGGPGEVAAAALEREAVPDPVAHGSAVEIVRNAVTRLSPEADVARNAVPLSGQDGRGPAPSAWQTGKMNRIKDSTRESWAAF